LLDVCGKSMPPDEILWYDLCRQEWSYSSVYDDGDLSSLSAKRLYLQLDEGTLTFKLRLSKGNPSGQT
ncbi:F-box only protein 8, partial [Caligus rogercresseyi]